MALEARNGRERQHDRRGAIRIIKINYRGTKAMKQFMNEISKEITFDAAHRLHKSADSPACEKLHGHTWRIRASWDYWGLNDEGMSVNFVLLKTILRKVHELFDHEYLNHVALPPVDIGAKDMERWNFAAPQLDECITGEERGICASHKLRSDAQPGHYQCSPTAENTAQWIFAFLSDETEKQFKSPRAIKLRRLELWETKTSRVTVEEATAPKFGMTQRD